MLPPGLCWQTPARTLHPAWRPVEANCGGNEKEANRDITLITAGRKVIYTLEKSKSLFYKRPKKNLKGDRNISAPC